MGVPDRIPIVPDEHYESRIGRLADGRLFFITEPFLAACSTSPGCEYLAVDLFAADGLFVEARIDSLGPHSTVDRDAARALQERRLAERGEVSFDSITVAPFSIEHDGVNFGLIPREPEDEDDDWWAELLPGDSMAFTDPWDGFYDM